ncbi:type II toxin-antitoxin system Phd/YefM family antitoxin [Streptomyces sp. NPDC014870]|uniref:type II toxin-antitoxin system Phd/YefM family antitoxin n=1 Tax=Streptomyces sp. NPDC014870 TaxID=3364925 RepID=UPI0036F7D0D1
MGAPLEAALLYDVHEVESHFDKILELVAAGHEVIITKSGEPIAKVIPPSGALKPRSRG